VGQLARTMVELALAAADAAEIEAQRGEIALLEHVKEFIDDLVVHRSAKLRVWMKHDRDRRVLFLRRLVATFEASGRACEDDFGHTYSNWPTLSRRGDTSARCLDRELPPS